MCQDQDESRKHIFVKCPYTRELWKKVTTWVQRSHTATTCWDQHLQWIIKQGKGKSKKASIFKMIYADISHAIWIEKNTCILEQRYRGNDVLVREIAHICNARVATRVRSYIQQFWLGTE